MRGGVARVQTHHAPAVTAWQCSSNTLKAASVHPVPQGKLPIWLSAGGGGGRPFPALGRGC